MPRITRLWALIAIKLISAGYYLYTHPELLPLFGGKATAAPVVSTQKLDDKSATLKLDEPTKQAIMKYFDGVSVDAKENDLNHAIQLDHGVGRPQLDRGETRAALGTYRKILAISYLQGSLMGVGIALNSLATVIDQTGDKFGAIYATFLAYKVAEALNNKEEIGVVELSFARRLWDEDKDMALPWLLRARESLKNSRYKTDYVRLLPDLAHGLTAINENERAAALYEEAWNLAHSLGKSHDQILAVRETGMHYAANLAQRKQYEKSNAVLEQTRQAFAANETVAPSYQTILHRLAANHGRLNQLDSARELYLSAYTFYDLARMNTPGEEGRLWLDENKKGLIDDIVNHFVQSNEVAMAVTILESNKAATLSDIVDDPAFGAAQSQWKQMQLRQTMEMAKLFDKQPNHELNFGESVLAALGELALKHRQEAQSLHTELKLKNVTAARSLSLEKLRAIQNSLPANLAILSFFVQHNKSAVFVVSRAGIQHIPVNLSGCDCMKSAQQLLVALANPNTDFYREPAQYLYKMLLGNALKSLPAAVDTILYSPDGPLARVPLAALMDGERFVGEKYAVYQVPSLRFLATPLQAVQAKEISGVACVAPEVGGEPMTGQREAGDQLAKLFTGRVVSLAGKACTGSALRAEIQKQKSPLFVHLGAPGALYPPKQMDAALLLSGQEKSQPIPWTGAQIAATDMSQVELVTLSMTIPGLPVYRYQRDAVGIVRPLFFAGAKRVLAPLWYLSDEAAGEFMKSFYRAYAKRAPASQALHQTQIALMKSEKYRHPHYWASYVLTEGM